MELTTDNYSYWELKQYFKKFDVIVIGSGIVGLSTAISLKKRNKKANILVLERGLMPNGASSKNAGFACFGSAGELLDDLKTIKEEIVWETVKMRYEGLNMLRERLGDKALDFKSLGGYELFDNKPVYSECREQIPHLNKKIKTLLGLNNCFSESKKTEGFKNVVGMINNRYEGQLDTSKMMDALALMAYKNGIRILNNIEITEIVDVGNTVQLKTNGGIFSAGKVVVATNGFASQLLKIKDVNPARAQVLITKPINGLKIKGTYHFQKGYYYFRNINQQLLFGGGRNLDFKSEKTTTQAINEAIHEHLDTLLREMIIPGVNYEVDKRWTGIMGVGKEKKPIVKKVSPNVLAAVRMGGMGIAIGTWVGETAARLLDE